MNRKDRSYEKRHPLLFRVFLVILYEVTLNSYGTD
jgi:hypothetical protein